MVVQAQDEGHPIDNLQLQKMLYFVQQECLFRFGRPAFDDAIVAEDYGPVVPSAYRNFSLWGGRKITMPVDIENEIEDPDVLSVVDEVLESLCSYEPWQLVDMYNVADSPWGWTWQDGAGEGDEIDQELIADFPQDLPV